MKLTFLKIQQLPGIQGEILLGPDDLDGGINVVTGPNTAGKSSLIRALGYLLRGHRRDDPAALALEARFSSGEDEWSVRRTGSGVSWLRNGKPVDAPPRLPDPDFFHCYWLSVEDLTTRHERDGDLTAQIRRDLSGGYDLEAIAGEAPFKVSGRPGGREAKALRKAESALRTVENEYRQLDATRTQIASLEGAIGGARRAREEGALAAAALEVLRLRQERLEQEAAFDDFPAPPKDMERLRGDESKMLEGLDAEIEEAKEAAQTGARAITAAEGQLAEVGFQDRGPDEAALLAQQTHIQKGREIVVACAGALRSFHEARSAESVAAENLGAAAGAVPDLGPHAVSQAETLAGEILGTRERLREIESRIGNAPPPVDPAEIDTHRDAERALERWLRWESRMGAGAAIPVGVTALLALVTAAAAWWGDAPVAAVLAVGLFLVAAYTLTRIRSGAAGPDRSRVAFGETGVAGPTAWTPEAVEARLEEIRRARAELHHRELSARSAESAEEQRAGVLRTLEELETAKRRLAEKFGFDPEKTAGSLHRFLSLVEAFTRARIRGGEADAALAEYDRDLEDRVLAVSRFLAEWGESGDEWTTEAETPATPERMPWERRLDELQGALDGLSARCRAATEARTKLARAREAVNEAKGRLEGLHARRRKLFEGCAVPDGDHAELTRRIEALDEFRSATAKLREAETLERAARAALQGSPDEAARNFLQQADSGEVEPLRERRRTLEAEAEELEALQKKHTELTVALRNAGADGKLEAARAHRDQAAAALEDQLEHALQAEAGAFLLAEIRNAYRSTHEPPVLKEARERFTRFTRHEWGLELTEARGIGARDLRSGELRSLDELSTGTRVQLLLAVRTAWTGVLEAGRESLPLFLDEALTTSDPDRFGEIGRTLEALSREEGRQIIYLTAQEMDVQLWERAMGSRPHVIDLGAQRGGAARGESPDFRLPERSVVPAPDGHSPEAYAEILRVPRVAPRQDAGSIHLFHLLRDDLTRLHSLMDIRGIRALGQLEGYLAAPGTAGTAGTARAAIEDEPVRTRLTARCQMARAWVELWRTGRGRPVDRGVLERSGAVTDRFIEPVSELAERLDGDAERLVAALRDREVPRFQSASADALEAWLEEEGYLDADTPLTAEEREMRLLERFSGSHPPEEIRRVTAWLEVGAGRH